MRPKSSFGGRGNVRGQGQGRGFQTNRDATGVNVVTYLGFIANFVPHVEEKQQEGGKDWLVDFGATHRVCGDKDLFIDMKSLKNPRDMECANGNNKRVEFVGTIEIGLPLDEEKHVARVKLTNVLYVPRAPNNLSSRPQLMIRGGKQEALGTNGSINLYNKKGMKVGKGSLDKLKMKLHWQPTLEKSI